MKINKNKNTSELDNLYRDQDGELPDMSKLDVKKSSTSSGIIFAVIFVLGLLSAAAWTGFIYFNNPGSFTSNNVSLEIKAPFTAVSGEEMIYTMTIKNNEPVTLQNGRLAATLPYGFFIEDSNYGYQKDSPDPSKATNNYIWNLPVILSQQAVNVTLKGQLIGEKGFKPILTAVFKYNPENVSSTFEKSVSFSTEISDSIVAITADYKNQIIQDEPTEILLQIKNTSQQGPMENLKLAFELPSTFEDSVLTAQKDNPAYPPTTVDTTTTASETPAKTTSKTKVASVPDYQKLTDEQTTQFNKNREILIEGLTAQGILKYKLNGKFKIEESGKQEIKIKVFAKDSHGDYQLQAEEPVEIQVVKGEILAELIINGNTENQPVSFGDTLTYLIHLKNKSKTTLGDVTVRAVISSAAIDWSTLVDKNKGTVNGNEITWTQSQVKNLAVMLPEGEAEISFAVKIKPYSAFSASSLPSPINSFYEATINKIESIETSKKIESKTIVNAFNSDTKLASIARYFDKDGVAVGTGPIPPVVDQKTTYQIVWVIDNSLNELNTLSVSTVLPDNVRLEDNSHTDAGTLSVEGQKVTWTINRMPKTVTQLKANFLVSITPKSTDVNKVLTLIKETTLSAIDKETGGTITITAAPQNTNLSDDPNAEGKGLVKAQE